MPCRAVKCMKRRERERERERERAGAEHSLVYLYTSAQSQYCEEGYIQGTPIVGEDKDRQVGVSPTRVVTLYRSMHNLATAAFLDARGNAVK